MTHLMTRRTALVTMATVTLAAPSLVRAATTHEVEMLSKHPTDRKLRNIFLPRIQVIEVGDTVRFVATDKGHNSAASKGMSPDGAETWKGRVNEEVEFTAAQPGLYGYECTPHMSVGMVGLVVVKGDGMMDNLEAAQSVRQRGKAKSAWADIWAELEGLDLTA